jgi:hypothetical protein
VVGRFSPSHGAQSTDIAAWLLYVHCTNIPITYIQAGPDAAERTRRSLEVFPFLTARSVHTIREAFYSGLSHQSCAESDSRHDLLNSVMATLFNRRLLTFYGQTALRSPVLTGRMPHDRIALHRALRILFDIFSRSYHEDKCRRITLMYTAFGQFFPTRA